jgi:hypothetical protein
LSTGPSHLPSVLHLQVPEFLNQVLIPDPEHYGHPRHQNLDSDNDGSSHHSNDDEDGSDPKVLAPELEKDDDNMADIELHSPVPDFPTGFDVSDDEDERNAMAIVRRNVPQPTTVSGVNETAIDPQLLALILGLALVPAPTPVQSSSVSRRKRKNSQKKGRVLSFCLILIF